MAGPRTTVEAQAFYRMYHSYADIPNPWDRLRWCRCGLDLLQKEVAAMVGMEKWLYRDLESGAFHRSFTPELADKLAALYGTPEKGKHSDGGFAPLHWPLGHPVFFMTGPRITEVSLSGST